MKDLLISQNEVLKEAISNVDKELLSILLEEFQIQRDLLSSKSKDVSDTVQDEVIEEAEIDKVQETKPPKPVEPNLKEETYHMVSRIIKNEETYSLLSDMNTSKIVPGYGLDQVKSLLLSNVSLQAIAELKDDNLVYSLYQDGKYIADIPRRSENFKFLSVLEENLNEMVDIEISAKNITNKIEESIFTPHHVRIINSNVKAPSIKRESSSVSIDKEFKIHDDQIDLDALFV